MLLGIRPKISVLTSLLYPMEFLVSFRTFLQISSLTVGISSSWHLQVVPRSLDTGRRRPVFTPHQQIPPLFRGIPRRPEGHSTIIFCLENFNSPLTDSFQTTLSTSARATLLSLYLIPSALRESPHSLAKPFTTLLWLTFPNISFQPGRSRLSMFCLPLLGP